MKDAISKEAILKLASERWAITLRSAHHKLAKKYGNDPLWSFVGDMTGFGSTYSICLCRALDWNPDQPTKRELKW